MNPSGLRKLLRTEAWHLPLVVAVSAVYESVFLFHWINFTDEGWPLYAATRLHEGGVLYRDVFFVFPPGHLLPAWIGAALDPPGVVLARWIYAAFNVALCVAMYLLGRRIVPPRWALLGSLLLAVAAPFSHRAQLLFGYRYLVFSVLALLAFARRLERGDPRWMFVAGAWAGVALCFRLTPAFAVSVGIGAGALLAHRGWREPVLDGLRYGVGAALVVLPVVAWLGAQVGLGTLWREVVVRPVLMTDLQSLPVPDLFLPLAGDRIEIHDAWVALLFRVVPLVYAGYGAALALLWARSRRRGEPFDHALLAAVVVWGGVYYVRSLGRSDEPHLSSAIPPFCLLLAHLLRAALGALGSRGWLPAAWRGPAALASASVLLAVWVWVPGVDRYLDAEIRGTTPYAPLADRVRLREQDRALRTEPMLRQIRELARPGSTILDMSAEPLLYLVSGRRGPGHHDVVMPGTFLDAEEERAFVARLERSPPELVVLPIGPFDNEPSRAVWRSAPQTMAWVARHYSLVGDDPARYLLLQRRPRREFPGK